MKDRKTTNGFRRECDPDGLMECDFQKFCVATARLGVFRSDPAKIFWLFQERREKRPKTIPFSDVSPKGSAFLEDFKHWCERKFGDPQRMFDAFDDSKEGSINMKEFVKACIDAGCCDVPEVEVEMS